MQISGLSHILPTNIRKEGVMHYIKLQGGRQMTLECSDANHVPAIHKKMPTYASPQAMVPHGASLL